MSSSSFSEQLAILRGLTASTGILHEAQVLQLKMWGAIAFGHLGAGNWEVMVDLDGRDVLYKLTIKKRRPKDLPNLIAALDNSIHFLLGEEWRLVVKELNKTLYRGERKLKQNKNERKQRTEDTT